MERTLALVACLNGRRARAEHPAVPLTPEALARDAKAAVSAGATVVHIHPRDASGRETFGRMQHAAAVTAVREAVPGTPVSVTTATRVEPDARRRLELVRKWTAVPDLGSVSWTDEGAPDLVAVLVEREIAVEAGISTLDDAARFVDSHLARYCARVLVNPAEERSGDALGSAERIVEVLRPLGLSLVVHGHGRTAWSLMRWAIAHGHGIRIGLEDTLSLEGGRIARDNAELVATAVRMAS